MSIMFALITNGTAGDRRVSIVFDGGTTAYYHLPSQDVQVASETINYNVAPVGAWANRPGTTTYFLIPIPNALSLGPGHRILTDTFNLKGGDNFDAPQLLVKEFDV